jgi:glucose-fructose oxidoreductase
MPTTKSKKIGYAIVGLGHIVQNAVLPAFQHTNKNANLVALVSDDQTKLRRLGKKYKVKNLFSYEEYEACLANDEVDAVYIGLPNSLHKDYTIRAARKGVHVLCEKPMALNVKECREMIEACDKHRTKLMIAYRLHYEKANLTAVDLVRSGKIGEPRIFQSIFSQQVEPGNIRLKKALGGGALEDMGIYCINAARYLFRDEPIEVFATVANNGEARFKEVDEMISVILRFPKEKLAMFTCSFGAAKVSEYQIIGAKGDLRISSAYTYHGDITHHLTINGKTKERTFPTADQFAAELLYFSDCILKGRTPEPSGKEGLIDMQIVEAIYRSIDKGRFVKFSTAEKHKRPDLKQAIRRPPVRKPELIKVESPSGEK